MCVQKVVLEKKINQILKSKPKIREDADPDHYAYNNCKQFEKRLQVYF